MHCLFCKCESSGSQSREHILPESLGNTQHVLPPGVVCDQCNNYFSREVEKPLLESGAIRVLRFQEALPSKRGIIPHIAGILLPDYPALARKTSKARQLVSLELEPAGIQHVLKHRRGEVVFPAELPPPPDRIVSRFLAKVALEALAHRLTDFPGGLEYLVREPQLDLARDHARRGTTPDWPFHVRRIYSEDYPWADGDGSVHQVVHEFDILETDNREWYLVLAIFGLELAFNIGGPEVDGYRNWLACHGGTSPLYWGKNAPMPDGLGLERSG